MENTMIVQPETSLIDKKSLSAVDQAKSMAVSTNQEMLNADAFCVALKNLEKEIIDTFADAKKKAHEAHRAITAAESKHLSPVQEARKIVKSKISQFVEEQERIRQVEERRLQEEAQKRAEDEALKLAQEAEKSGNKDEAEAIIQAPVEVPQVIVEKTTPKSKTVIRKQWTFSANDLSTLSDAELLSARAYLKWDDIKLGQQARATQDTVKVSGVKFYWRAI